MNEEYTVEIQLPAHKRGDRWPGIAAIGPVLINGVQPTNGLTRVRMHFKNAAGTIYRLDTDSTTTPDAPIIIDNATTWAASIPEVEDFISANGKWQWDMEFYEAGKTAPLTLYKGSLTVGNDITR
jgi:hypothetical protein